MVLIRCKVEEANHPDLRTYCVAIGTPTRPRRFSLTTLLAQPKENAVRIELRSLVSLLDYV
jgi:hypothetical protein